MALRFIDSMAHYDNVDQMRRKWTIANIQSWQGSGGRRNSAYVQFNGNQGMTKTVTHSNNFTQGVAAIMQPGAGELGGTILAIGNNQHVVMALRMNADATMSITVDGTQVGLTTLAVPDPTSWHYYEMAANVGVASGFVTGTGVFNVDGHLMGSFSGASGLATSGLLSNNATVNVIGVPNSAAMGVMDYYCLDTSTTDINGIAGSTNITFLGDVEIDALFPDADVTTNWGTVGGDGTHAYSAVNENPPDDDTSYILTTATGSKESFNYQPITGFTGDILGAQYLVCARKDQEGPRVITLPVGTSLATSIEFLDEKNFLSDYYVYYICPLDTDFGTAWSTSVYNAEVFGIILAT